MDFKKLLPLILSGVATFFAFLGIIMLIVCDGDVWGYMDKIFTFISIAGLLTFTILEFVNVSFNKYLYAIAFSGLAIAELLSGIRSLVDMGDGYSKYLYFTSFVSSLFNIFVMLLFLYGLYKKNTIISVFSLTYLASDLLVNGLSGFNQIISAMFGGTGMFKWGFSGFVNANALLLFYVVFAIVGLKYIKENQN